MSVSITTVETEPQLEELECEYCAESIDDRCPFCKGEVVYYDRVHYMNMANSNARLILGMVGLEDEYLCGSLKTEEIPAVRQRIIRALNNGATENWARETQIEGRYIQFGYDAERIGERLRQLDGILARAQEVGAEVSWG